MNDRHANGTIAENQDGTWGFACACGYSTFCPTFEGANWAALTHGTNRREIHIGEASLNLVGKP
jgi:hypothetical protein